MQNLAVLLADRTNGRA